MNWHTLDIEHLLHTLGASRNGLSDAEVSERLQRYGTNSLEQGKEKPLWLILVLQFKDVMIALLLVAAIISAALGDMADAIVIMIIVAMNALIGGIQEYRAQKAVKALKQMVIPQARVYRQGQQELADASQLVPGDIVVLEAGNAIPADIRLLEAVNLKCAEAALTGESESVEKIAHLLHSDDTPLADRSNMVYKGTFVSQGRGTGVVVATGMQTQLGQIARMLQEPESLTPLQQRLAQFSKKLTVIILVLCIVFFAAGWFRGEPWMNLLLTSISLAVAAIPEALPAVISISLALAARRMIKLRALVRKLPAVETLGSVTYICTDKTGTLTKNEMTVEALMAQGERYLASQFASVGDNSPEVKQLLQAMAHNHDAIRKQDDSWLGDSTETALAKFAHRWQNGPQLSRVAEIPFDSDRKLMTTFHSVPEGFLAFTKGAPDILLARCSQAPIHLLQSVIEEWAAAGYRIIGFASKWWNQLPEFPNAIEHETDLQFLGIVALIDPPREEVPLAVKQCQQAGITPVMITGDHPLTAISIARRLGLAKDDNQIITGKELQELPDADFSKRIAQWQVYARVTPEQKLRIVKSLQERGHYVAMTGDGVNDAPALKRADIGVAMGITGTDVSKEAADMILLDDNFATIVGAVAEGRRVYDNMLKFIKYLMTTNSGELWTLLIGPMIGLPVALLPIHILWINLVSDGLPAISLSFERAERDVMKRPPRPAGESVFAQGRGWHVLWVGLLMAVLCLGAQWWAMRQGWHWQTVVFNLLCLSQMAHVLAIRSQTFHMGQARWWSNPMLLLAVLAVVLAQIGITYIPAMQNVFHTQPLDWKAFLTVGVLSAVVFIAVEAEKILTGARRSDKAIAA